MKILGTLMTFCLVITLSAAAFGQKTVKPVDNSVKTADKSIESEDLKPTETIKIADTKTVADTPNKVAKDRYRIGYQDTLEITVSRHDDLSGQFNVNTDGTIYLSRLDKPLVAVCKTERELAREITEAYKKDYLRDPFVNVRVVDQKSQSFAVIGAVEKPGTFYVNRRIRLLELLSFAGGPNKEAGQKLIVARTGSLSACREDSSAITDEDAELALLNYKITDITAGKENLWMEPGDIVSVMDAEVIYVVGNVNKPQEIKLKEPITLSQAIAASEGVKSTTDKEAIRILRRKEDSFDREELVFNLKDIETQKISDPVLEPNDIVAVSKDNTKVAIRGLMDVLKSGIPSLFYRF